MTEFQKAQQSADFIRTIQPEAAEVGIVLGSGLGGFVDHLQDMVRISYHSIPHFPVTTVEGHSGELIFGNLNGIRIWAMSGRFHYYEAYELNETVFPLRVLKLLGVKRLVVSNAAGGLNPDFEPGDLMLVTDQIDLFPDNPLRGKDALDFGIRFPDMSGPFDTEWQELAKKRAGELGIPLHEGVYVGTKGPSLETRAEIRHFRMIGGDAVGMSTVPEVIAARQMGIKVIGFSVITNQCLPQIPKEFTHEEVVAVANRAGGKLLEILKGILQRS